MLEEDRQPLRDTLQLNIPHAAVHPFPTYTSSRLLCFNILNPFSTLIRLLYSIIHTSQKMHTAK